MEIQQLEGLSRLRCISITEIVFAVLNITGAVFLLLKVPNAHIWTVVLHILFDIFLMITGALGVYAVRRSLHGVASIRLFYVVAAFNIISCVLYSIAVIICIILGVILIWSSDYLKKAMEKVGEWMGEEPGGEYFPLSPGGTKTTAQNVNVVVFVVLVVGISVICIFVLVCAILTGAAAKISRRNATILEAAPVTVHSDKRSYSNKVYRSLSN